MKTSSSVIRTSAWPSPVEIDEAQVRIVPVEVGQRRERSEGLPVARRACVRRSPAVGPAKLDQVELAIARQVEELLPAAAEAASDGLSATARLGETGVTSPAVAECSSPRFGL